MKLLFICLAMTLSFSSFAESYPLECLSSVQKDHKAVVTKLSFTLVDGQTETALRTEYGLSGEVTKTNLEILDVDVMTNQRGEVSYLLVDLDADFYVCSAN